MKTKIPAHGLRGLQLREAAPDLMIVVNLVRGALEVKVNGAAPGVERKWFDVEAVYADRVVIRLENRYWSYPYTLVGTTVTLSDPSEVIETFEALREAAPLRLVEAEGVAPGTAWEVTIIQAGVSLNGAYYPDAVLRESAPLFDGARIFVKGDIEHVKGAGKDVRQLVGWVESPRFVEGAQADAGRLVATIRLPGLPEETRNLLVAAAEAGRTDLVGLSIDATGRGTTRMIEGRRVKAAASITRVDSVDLIVEPGAGGRLVRLVEAAPVRETEEENSMRKTLLQQLKDKAPAAYAKLNADTVTDEEILTAYREAFAQPDTTRDRNAPAAGANGGGLGADALEQVRMIEARMRARELIGASTLPQPAKDRLTADFLVRERFVEADVTAAIEAERSYLARFVESGRVNLGGFPDIQVQDRSVAIAGMLDAFFDPQHKDHRNVQSFRECYVEITGDRKVTGRLQDCDQTRMRESLGARFREATMDTAAFAVALGDSITRRMLADYRTPNQFDVWRLAANVVPVNDFRTQERIRWGGFGDLPAVAQGADYQDGAIPDDEKATYAATKRGRLAIVTLEMIRNDDVGMVREIPVKLSRAAKRTLGKFVLDFPRANAAIYDTKAFFHADHGNLGAAALDATTWAAARLAIMSQTEAGSGDRLGIPPKYLWVPAGLEETAYNLFKQRGTNNDQSFIQSQAPTVVPVWYWTDANDWAASTDVLDVPGLEIGFLDGNQEPEIFVQDSPTVGSLFASDTITYKIRHIYGGAVVDYRGWYKAVVA